MLSVSFSLAMVAEMLFGILLPGHHNEVDKFNGQTREPIPAGSSNLVHGVRRFKVEGEQFLQKRLSWGTRLIALFFHKPACRVESPLGLRDVRGRLRACI